MSNSNSDFCLSQQHQSLMLALLLFSLALRQSLTWPFHLKHPVHWGFLGGNVWSSEVEMWDMGSIPVKNEHLLSPRCFQMLTLMLMQVRAVHSCSLEASVQIQQLTVYQHRTTTMRFINGGIHAVYCCTLSKYFCTINGKMIIRLKNIIKMIIRLKILFLKE